MLLNFGSRSLKISPPEEDVATHENRNGVLGLFPFHPFSREHLFENVFLFVLVSGLLSVFLSTS